MISVCIVFNLVIPGKILFLFPVHYGILFPHKTKPFSVSHQLFSLDIKQNERLQPILMVFFYTTQKSYTVYQGWFLWTFKWRTHIRHIGIWLECEERNSGHRWTWGAGNGVFGHVSPQETKSTFCMAVTSSPRQGPLVKGAPLSDWASSVSRLGSGHRPGTEFSL